MRHKIYRIRKFMYSLSELFYDAKGILREPGELYYDGEGALRRYDPDL